MGMFDSIRDATDTEWQTKAYYCALDTYEIGDPVPQEDGEPIDYQVEVLGGAPDFIESLATVREGRIVVVPAERDESLQLMSYYGGWPVTEVRS